MSNRVRTTITVEIAGEVIARFANSEDAVFFATKANEAELFSISHPGKEARAYDHRGAELTNPGAYTSR